MIRSLFALILLVSVTGCSVLGSGNGQGTLISTVRPVPTGIEVISIQLTTTQISTALEASRGSENIRLVPLVTSAAQAPATPEYRLFNVKPGSIAALIGLKNADTIIAAQDYVIQAPSQFYNYLQVLPLQKSSSVEIRRDGKPIRIESTITQSN